MRSIGLSAYVTTHGAIMVTYHGTRGSLRAPPTQPGKCCAPARTWFVTRLRISYLAGLTIPYRVKPSTSAWPVTSKPRFE